MASNTKKIMMNIFKGANISNLNEDEAISSIDVSSSELRNNANIGDIATDLDNKRFIKIISMHIFCL